ncbi:helix-turn-helix domain-containing protein [Candidatus Methylopumilus turicensis]|uniref:helix-turn-helix domain-containing protein n=1 Tax=Candidatus Methylopumilus turicensis TaxID=1581680 RepID=UPI0018D33E8E|nr:helix-turn-helix transcriptional regulator [Candidatus Methylopumilus turicensis]
MKILHSAILIFIQNEKGVFLIKCHLSRIMGEKKLRVADVARAVGVHRNAITLLYEETASRVEMDTINKLCAFLDCGIQDLFEYLPEGEN